MDMFTRAEAFDFLKNNLKVKDAGERMKTDRKNLLDEIAINMQTQLVFQNLKLLCEDPEKRRRPSLEEIKADLLSGIGGLCYNLNIAAYFLLKAIGFKATIAHATCTSTVIFPDNHVVVYVDNVEKNGDRYLVEVGFGFPTYRAISMDFETESSAYFDSFIEYKYIRHEGKVLRMHRKGDLAKSLAKNAQDGVTFMLDGWRRFYYANTEGNTNVEEFYEPFDQVFTNPKASPFHLSFRLIGFPGKKAVMIVNERTLIQSEDGVLEPKSIEGGDEGIIQAVKQYFPVIPEDLARKALASWRKTTQ